MLPISAVYLVMYPNGFWSQITHKSVMWTVALQNTYSMILGYGISYVITRYSWCRI